MRSRTPGALSRASAVRRPYFEQASHAAWRARGNCDLERPFSDGGSGTTIKVERNGTLQETNAQWRVVYPGFQETLAIPLSRGRTIASADGATSAPVVLVNEAMALAYWPTATAVGERLQIDGQWHTVVGVAGNVKHYGLDQLALPTFYIPATQTRRRGLVIVLKTDGLRSVYEKWRSASRLEHRRSGFSVSRYNEP